MEGNERPAVDFLAEVVLELPDAVGDTMAVLVLRNLAEEIIQFRKNIVVEKLRRFVPPEKAAARFFCGRVERFFDHRLQMAGLAGLLEIERQVQETGELRTELLVRLLASKETDECVVAHFALEFRDEDEIMAFDEKIVEIAENFFEERANEDAEVIFRTGFGEGLRERGKSVDLLTEINGINARAVINIDTNAFCNSNEAFEAPSNERNWMCSLCRPKNPSRRDQSRSSDPVISIDIRCSTEV